MAISRIRGEQIRQGVLNNAHIEAGAAIEESKLAVNWSSHYTNALETKKVIDYVQVGAKDVSGLSELNLTLTGVLLGTVSQALSTGSTEGAIIDAPYNKIIIRDVVTGEPVLDAEGEEVFGRLVHDGVDYKVLFLSPGAVGEELFVMEANQQIDFQYMERFNLKTVSELFAANEKFVAGAADITAHQNIEQLAADIYGAGYSLNRDGQGTLTVSLAEQISDEVQARISALQAIRDDLMAAGEVGKGAHLIGVQDLTNAFTSVTVEGALEELHVRLAEQELTGGQEVEEAHHSLMTGDHETLDLRLEADVTEILARLTTEKQRAEAAELALDGRTDALELAVSDALNSTAKSTDGGATPKVFVSVDARLEEAEADHKVEVARATQAEADLAQDIADELTRATTAEEAIAEGLAQELIDRAADVQAEEDRAVAAEAVLTQAVVDEKDRAEAAELALDGRSDAIELELETARGTEASLDVRLDRALNDNGTLKAGQLIHEHFRARFQAIGGEAEVLLTAFTSKKVLPAAFKVGDDSLEVFINGQLQEESLNYSEGLLGEKIVFNTGDGTVLEPTDIVQIKFHINNAE